VLQPTGERYEDHNGDWIVVNDDGLISEIRAYITNNIQRTFNFQARIEALIATG
jgi:hypothetical protein